MAEAAAARGGNAVLAMRFDTSEMGDQWTEICAYGTAVKISPRPQQGLAEGPAGFAQAPAYQPPAPYQPPPPPDHSPPPPAYS